MATHSPTGSIPSQSGSIGSDDAYGTREGPVPTAVHGLLEATRRLQDVLNEWGAHTASVDDVSDVYVRVVEEFNAAIQAFAECGIDLGDLYVVPQEMRATLEQCLAEEPSPEALARFLPELKQTLIKLLRGLKRCHPEWRASLDIAPSRADLSPPNSR